MEVPLLSHLQNSYVSSNHRMIEVGKDLQGYGLNTNLFINQIKKCHTHMVFEHFLLEGSGKRSISL